MGLLARLFGRKTKDRDVVTFDADKVLRTLPDGRTESVRWDELEKVWILTTEQGPAADDVFWMLDGKSGGCSVPSEAEGMQELLLRLQRLPGFNNAAVIQAMGSTANAQFLCWSRSNAP
jgi:hypothetical protein